MAASTIQEAIEDLITGRDMEDPEIEVVPGVSITTLILTIEDRLETMEEIEEVQEGMETGLSKAITEATLLLLTKDQGAGTTTLEM